LPSEVQDVLPRAFFVLGSVAEQRYNADVAARSAAVQPTSANELVSDRFAQPADARLNLMLSARLFESLTELNRETPDLWRDWGAYYLLVGSRQADQRDRCRSFQAKALKAWDELQRREDGCDTFENVQRSTDACARRNRRRGA